MDLQSWDDMFYNDQAMFMKLINNMCRTPIHVESFLTFQSLMIQNV